MLVVLGSTGNSFMGKVIQRVTWNKYTHVAVTDGNIVWECAGTKGVVCSPIQDWNATHDCVETVPIQVEHENEIIRWMGSRVGFGYDYLELVGHVLNINLGSRKRYTCSSFVMEAINKELTFLNHKDYFKIQPRHVCLACYAHARALGFI